MNSLISPIFTNLEISGGSSDLVNVSATGAFIDKNIGTNKQINISSTVLSGTDATNYTLSNSQSTTNANITAKGLTVTGTVVANKIYDATTTATLSNGTLVGVIASDVANVTLTQAGTFADKNAGTGKVVTAADSLSGSEDGKNGV